MYGSVTEGEGGGATSGLRLEGRMCSMLTVIRVRVRLSVRVRVNAGLGFGYGYGWGQVD